MTSGALVLRERIGLSELLAGLVIVAGVFLAMRPAYPADSSE